MHNMGLVDWHLHDRKQVECQVCISYKYKSAWSSAAEGPASSAHVWMLYCMKAYGGGYAFEARKRFVALSRACG
jgi:hypothetical protein